MPTTRRLLGNAGETLAVRVLETAGLTILERNWRCAVGELDIIAEETAPDYLQGGVLATWRVLVEVRTRRGQRFGTARQSIIPSKANKLRQVGATYIQSCGWQGPWRIDVVAVQMDASGKLLEVEHIRGAVTG